MPAKIRISGNSPKFAPLNTPKRPVTVPSPVERKFELSANESTFSKLPFVQTQNHDFNPVSNWHVPPAEDYSQACNAGREYAAHFVQYLRDNPDMCGANLLGVIAKDIDFKDTSNTAGYWVGFFSHLEKIICAQT